MKKSIIVCNLCHKELEEKTSKFATIFINENGCVTGRVDVCMECLNGTLHPVKKGGAE